MCENKEDALLEIVKSTIAFDEEVRVQNIEKADEPELTFKRDENGVLWSYNVNTGKKVGRIYEHGDNAETKKSYIDEIEEI